MNIKDIRSYRIFGLAIFDIVLSMIGMIVLFIIAKLVFFKELDMWKFIVAAVFLTIPFGIVVHVLIGQNTTLNYNLGLSDKT